MCLKTGRVRRYTIENQFLNANQCKRWVINHSQLWLESWILLQCLNNIVNHAKKAFSRVLDTSESFGANLRQIMQGDKETEQLTSAGPAWIVAILMSRYLTTYVVWAATENSVLGDCTKMLAWESFLNDVHNHKPHKRTSSDTFGVLHFVCVGFRIK